MAAKKKAAAKPKAMDLAVEAVVREVDVQGDPSRMSKADYSEFLAILIDDFRIRKETNDYEMENDEDR